MCTRALPLVVAVIVLELAYWLGCEKLENARGQSV